MANESLPAYLASAKPNSMENRGPWFTSIAPTYAGIFLWWAFYDLLGTALPVGGLGAALIGLVVAGVLSHLLFYKVFGLLGMQTGYPLYVVGSSTFGTKGGLIFPGIFMGLLQIGWYSVATYFTTDLLLRFLKHEPLTVLGPPESQGFSLLFVVVAIALGYVLALIGAFGVQYVAKVSQFFPVIPLVMLIIAAIGAAKGIGSFEAKPAEGASLSTIAGICLVVQMVIGFFATAGAAGADFGTGARNAKDIDLGGWFGVALAVVVAGGLAILTVAGANGIDPELGKFSLRDTLETAAPSLAGPMFLLFAIGSIAPACFCSSIIGNSLSTMIPSLPRVGLTLGGATIGIALAALGLAGNLAPFFGLIGASFGPICGAMVADYLLSGRKWSGPREGVNIAGYAAWVIGFLVGISNNEMVTKLLGCELLPNWQPAAVYSFIAGFVVYAVLAKAGLQPKTIDFPMGESEAK